MLALVPPALRWTLPEVSPGKSSSLLFLSKPGQRPLPFGFLVVDTPWQVPLGTEG